MSFAFGVDRSSSSSVEACVHSAARWIPGSVTQAPQAGTVVTQSPPPAHTHTRTRGGVSTATRAAGRTGLLRSAEPVAFPGAGGGSMTVHGSATVRGPSRAPKPPSAYGVCAFLRRLRLRTAVCCLSVLIVSAGRARAGHTDRHRPCLNAVGRCTTLPAVAGTGMVVPVAGTARLAQESAW